MLPHCARAPQSAVAPHFLNSTSPISLLSNLLGERVDLTSIPGGEYSRQVAEAAAQVGVRTLFISEPTVRRRQIAGYLILGRYSMRRWTAARTAAAIASGK